MNKKRPENFHNAMLEIAPILENLIEEKSKLFIDLDDKNDFIFSCAINLIGNMVIRGAADDIDKYEILSKLAIKRLVEWFSMIMAYKLKLKETH